ncbi:flagellar assembly protein FliH [Helicobacter trogontum]|uniref:Flagellar assembly protein FliH n=1 Tax=Helicobacter trogontum TaxID=50960 RepID=A0A4U8TA07_9HELI|nr:flagellar assembly protein FliH [Helicobacter trogontum]MDY5186335.1 flagellar assembly protein FliH [Helicobacter trogontum]TLD96639.1 flagellar assembly protein FliH [Helicobacter trogontum]
MLSRNHNLIQDEQKDEHSINKYEFKAIVPLEVHANSSVDSAESITDEQSVEQVNAYRPQPMNSLEKELIEKLLHKSDELSGNLAKLEMQFEKSQVSMQETLEKTSDESYKRGFEEGKNEAKQAMEAEIRAEREKIVQSLITLENTLKQSQVHLEALEKELSSIAIDMAKEVIVKEIEANSQRVALELTRSLLSNIMEATQISIKVNPIDYVYLKENLKDREKIQIEADNAISRGGIVISSNLGNLDGNVMSRYKMLKQSVLDNLDD